MERRLMRGASTNRKQVSGNSRDCFTELGSRCAGRRILIETRSHDSISSGLTIQLVEPAKINRDIELIESPVSYSKQRSGPQINRNKIKDSPRRASREKFAPALCAN